MKSNEHNSLAHTHWHWHRHSRSLQVLCGTPFLIFLLRLHERQSTTTTNSSTTTEQIKSRAPLRTIIISSSFFRDFTFYFFFVDEIILVFCCFLLTRTSDLSCVRKRVCVMRALSTPQKFSLTVSLSLSEFIDNADDDDDDDGVYFWRYRLVFVVVVFLLISQHTMFEHTRRRARKTHTHGEKICFALTASSSCFHDSPFYFFFFLCCLFQSCFSDTEASVGFFSCTV